MAIGSQVPYVLQLMLAGPKRIEKEVNIETEVNRSVKTLHRCLKAGQTPLPLKSEHDSVTGTGKYLVTSTNIYHISLRPSKLWRGTKIVVISSMYAQHESMIGAVI